MERDELCRQCYLPTKDYASNTIQDYNGDWIQCPRCAAVNRHNNKLRHEWNRKVASHVQKLDINLQDRFQYDLEHGTLRPFMFNMRESGRSPGEAVRAWRDRILYAASERRTTRQRPKSSKFEYKLDTIPQRQYCQPEKLPIVYSPPMQVAMRPAMPVIFAKPTYVAPVPRAEPQPIYIRDTQVDYWSDTSSEASSPPPRNSTGGIVREKNGRISVAVTDSRGNMTRGRSALAYFAT